MARPDSEALDYEAIKDKPETVLQTHLADWILEKCGLEDAFTKPAYAAFREGVRLSTVLRMAHQASPENKARQVDSKAAKEDETEAKKAAAAERKAARAAAKTDKPDPKRRVVKKVVVEEPPADQVKKPRSRPKKVVEAAPEPGAEKAAPKRRGRPPGVKPALSVVKDEAPVEPAKTPRRRAVAKAASASVTEAEKPTVVRRRRATSSVTAPEPVVAAGVRTRPKPRTAPSTQEAPF